MKVKDNGSHSFEKWCTNTGVTGYMCPRISVPEGGRTNILGQLYWEVHLSLDICTTPDVVGGYTYPRITVPPKKCTGSTYNLG